MRRLTLAAIAVVTLATIAITALFLVGKPAVADLDPKACSPQIQVFTSRVERVRIVVPRGWCATDHPSYPGLLVSMLHTQPPGQILLTSEPFTRELYCSWPVQCRNQTTNTAKYACALRDKLTASKMRVGPTQLGPKENELAGLPSVWFEFDDGRRFLRQAVAVTADRALSLVLSAPTIDARTSHVRPFDQALRTLQLLTTAQANAPINAPTPDAEDAGVPDDAVPETDAGPNPSAGSGSSTPPPPRESPIGPCPK